MGRGGVSRVRGRWLVGASILALIACPAAAQETTRYTYDALGRVTGAIDSSGRKVTYAYDAAGNRTRLSNGAEFAEILPTGWTASSNAGTTGLTAANGMRDGQFGPLASIHATNTETDPWIRADLGSVKTVNHIEVAAAVAAPVSAGIEDLNGAVIEISNDGTNWRSLAAVSGIGVGATRTIALGGVSLRYLRLKRAGSGQVALGDLRLYSAAGSNSPLIAEPDAITTQGSAVTFDPRTNDRDLDGHAFTIAQVEDPPHGTAVINGGGVSITYTPDAGYKGADSFLYAVADGHNGTASARVAVTVQSATNTAPVAVPDAFTVSDRTIAAVDGTNDLRPLLNDQDPDGDKLTITNRTNPAHGTATIVGADVIKYQPTVGHTGPDSFSYTISDGRGLTATTSINISVDNAAPIANPDTATTAKNTPVTLDVLVNDTDPNGDTITITELTQPEKGTASFVGGAVTYTPQAGFVGAERFTYTSSDGRGKTATGVVSVTVSTPELTQRLAIMQPAQYQPYATVKGNIFEAVTSSSVNAYVPQAIAAGKVYWEVQLRCGLIHPGVTNSLTARSMGGWGEANAGIRTLSAETWVRNGSGVATSLGAGQLNDIYGFALDADTRKLKIYKNNVAGPTLTLGFSGPFYAHAGAQTIAGSPQFMHPGQPCVDGTASGEFRYGADQLMYAPPAGYTPLTTTINSAPRAFDDNLWVAAGSTKVFDPRINDGDADGDALTVTAVSAPAKGSASLVNGLISYTAPSGYLGLDSIIYTLADGKSGTAQAIVLVEVGAGSPQFTISPAFQGKTSWNVDVDGPLNLGSPGIWTIVPQNDFTTTVKTWGAAGGAACCTARGGAGGFATAFVPFSVGVPYKLYVGGGGSYQPKGANGGFNGGGNGGSSGSRPGGGGGGWSGVRLSAGQSLLIAGGGGGEGWGGLAGDGGGATGGAGGAYNGLAGGVSGGGSAYQGGVGASTAGGGGGGGYVGGGGGGGNGATSGNGGGGAGGNGYADPTLSQASLIGAANAIPAAIGDIDRGSAGSPGVLQSDAGGAGRLVLGAPRTSSTNGEAANRAPSAKRDLTYVAPGATTVLFPMSNDTDPDADVLKITAIGTAAHGTVSIVGNGSAISYTRNAADTVADQFEYTITDGRGGIAKGAVVVLGVQAGFYQPTLRVMTTGFSGTVGATSFNITPSGTTTALGSAAPFGLFSYEIDVSTITNYPYFGVATQAWFDAGANFGVTTPAAGFWMIGVGGWNGAASGTTSEWFGDDQLNPGDIVGVTYNGFTREIRIYRNGSLRGRLVLPSTIDANTLYPVVGVFSGQVSGSFRATPSSLIGNYAFE